MKNSKQMVALSAALLLGSTSGAQTPARGAGITDSSHDIVVDVHSHILDSSYRDFLKQHNAEAEEGFPLPQWSVETCLNLMDEAGIQTAVLTMPAPQPYFGNAEESARAVRQSNEAAARAKAKHPGRFLFCAALPLPDVDAAVREAVYALDTLHADGIKLATNARGQYLGTPELDTLMSVLNERNAVIIIHPHKPDPMNTQVMEQTPLAMEEYLAETTRAVANMITRNVPARYSNLKFVVPHCGAFMPLAVPRMKSLTSVMQSSGLVGDIDWDACLQALYYDLAGAHSPETIRQMLTITTPDHLLYGSDYPYVAAATVTAGLERMKTYLLEETDLQPYREMILGQNALRLFGGDEAATAPQVQSRGTTFPLRNKAGRATHTGDVYLSVMASGDYCMTTAFLFEAGSRGRWHMHPDAEQTLLILSGYGYYQEEGKPKRLLRKGDVITTPRNVRHWNGATPWSHCECITVTDLVKGLEHAIQMEEVSDEVFNAPLNGD